MKKFRSKLPRRKRSKLSPIIISSPALKFDATSIIDSASNLTRDVDISCDTSSRVSTNNKSLKKRSFAGGNVAVDDKFRRITRSYSKRMEMMAEKAAELSKASSCVELFNANSKSIIRRGPAVLRKSKADNHDEVSVTVCEIENSVVTTRSECSIFPKELMNVRDNLQVNEETDVVSVSSRVASPRAKLGTTSHFNLSETTVNEGQSAYTKGKNYAVSVAYRLESQPAPKPGEIALCINKSEANETFNDDQAENCGESKLISVEFDLTCSEHLSSEDEECDYSSAQCTDDNMESSELEFSSDFATSTWYDSGSQFSERSVGDTTPSPTFQLFLVYRQKFCKSEFSTKVSSEFNNEPSNRIINWLSPEDEEHEESYWMMKKRERRQVYLHDYAEEYCGMKECGDLVVKLRLQMVHWIIEQSANKEFQKETMFLGVSLLDRFLSKGYFRNKRELEIAGISCLTLATRIEENQPYNSIRQMLFKVGSNEYSRSDVVAMEWLVQEVLNFQCFLPTIYNFLWFYLKAASANQNVDKTAKHIAVVALLGHEQLCYWPSTVAASLVILACISDNQQSSRQQIARIYDGSNDKDIHNCLKSLEWLVNYIC